jgi:hypothetical protein
MLLAKFYYEAELGLHELGARLVDPAGLKTCFTHVFVSTGPKYMYDRSQSCCSLLGFTRLIPLKISFGDTFRCRRAHIYFPKHLHPHFGELLSAKKKKRSLLVDCIQQKPRTTILLLSDWKWARGVASYLAHEHVDTSCVIEEVHQSQLRVDCLSNKTEEIPCTNNRLDAMTCFQTFILYLCWWWSMCILYLSWWWRSMFILVARRL